VNLPLRVRDFGYFLAQTVQNTPFSLIFFLEAAVY
jgi:hypothetical protein